MTRLECIEKVRRSFPEAHSFVRTSARRFEFDVEGAVCLSALVRLSEAFGCSEIETWPASDGGYGSHTEIRVSANEDLEVTVVEVPGHTEPERHFPATTRKDW